VKKSIDSRKPRSGRQVRSLGVAAVLAGAGLFAGGYLTLANADDTLQKARQQGYVDVGIGAGGFPYAALAPDGKAIGAAPEITIAVLKGMGISDVHPQVVDWGALIPGLMAKRYDIVTTGMFMNSKRCEAVLFSKPDTCSLESFMVPKGNPLNLHTFKDIANNPTAKITMAPGSNEVKMAEEAGVPSDRMVTNTDVQSRLKLLQTGRVNVWVDPSDTFSALQDKDPTFEVLQVTGVPVACAGAAFRKEDRDFRDAYDGALTKIQQSGEFDAILAKYGFPADVAKKASRDQLCEGPN
jgi:polar amino acid transport system substrate-binding protein